MTNYEYVKNFRCKQKEKIVYVMGGKCACCGYNKCISALELHHLDPTQKEFTFSKNTNRAWSELVKELPKTILLCANCHREVHSGIINNEELFSSFEDEKAQEISAKEKVNNKEPNRCIDCGTLISSHATRCVKCAEIHRRTVPRPDRKELKEMIRTMPFTTIGKQFGVTDNAVRKWCDNYNLPRKSAEIKQFSDEEWESI